MCKIYGRFDKAGVEVGIKLRSPSRYLYLGSVPKTNDLGIANGNFEPLLCAFPWCEGSSMGKYCIPLRGP